LTGTPHAPLKRLEEVMNKDELKGKFDQAKGRAKQGIGNLTDDEQLRSEGQVDEVVGKVEEVGGRARRKVGETIEDLGDAIKK
jgi:uncharacterized protein YjbJ (UPF0337 family)